MLKTRSNQMIECVRFISCMFVLFVHCPFPSQIGTYVTMIGRYAVPFFLLLSGYFSYNNNPIPKAKKKIRDTLRIVLVAGLVCLVWNSVNSFIETGNFVEWFHPYLTLKTIRNLLIYNRATFFNSTFYYFFMLIYVYSIFILSCKTNTIKHLYYISPVLFLLLFVVATMGQWYWGGNFLFLGIPMFYLGHFIHSHQGIIDFLKGKEIIGILLGVLLSYIELKLRIHTTYIYFGSVLISVSLLCFCINNADSKCPNFLAHLGTAYSLYIMVFHCQVRDTLQLCITSDSFLFPVLVLVTTIVFSSVINAFSKRV